jgi:hypothetical protein
MRNATTTKKVNHNSPVPNPSLPPSSLLAPLAEILNAEFHIDISRDEAFIVQAITGSEFPLSLLSIQETNEIREKACDQYVLSVLSGGEAIDRDRATLFFISRYCDSNGRLSLQNKPDRKSRSSNHRSRRRGISRSHGENPNRSNQLSA